ncbi:PulJ/GspJ family protein [Cohnella fermenti]|uniref:Prepilin-type N-terminal cleavage/methylation domain-containing protein n=1 Tax=Cohnella fermenti TaxID=2565925 RepID=A0A4S4BVD0_9BACL|nr:prepilin-type N-terminal cleavage/methylation domain-containing protein [Cohnella fermenti]THF76948.1 prepilin-type N-terminal cleavage/methylation domain-containing protein [Cohnella fermenti]
MSTIRRGEGGFSLLEVLAAIVILSIVSLAMTSFFVHAMTYSKGNENKTIEVNLARNALFFLGKQDFDRFLVYLTTSGNGPISTRGCEKLVDGVSYSCPGSPSLASLFEETPLLWDALKPVVNGKEYEVEVAYNESVLDGKEAGVKKYLLPVKVSVAESGSSRKSGRNSAEVEGYITDEQIRE